MAAREIIGTRRWIALLAVMAVGCSASSFRGSAAKTKLPAPVAQGEQNGADGNTGGSSNGGNSNGGGNTPGERPADPCSNGSQQEYNVLIADFKSGWFAGDGGNFFNEVLNGVCGERVKISYIHFTKENTVSNLGASALAKIVDCEIRHTGPFGLGDEVRVCTEFHDLSKFDALWLLSGDEADDEDVELDSSLFRSLLVRAKALLDAKPKSAYFFGAGLGNIQHANLLAQQLFPGIAGNSGDADKGLFAPTGGERGTLPSSNYPKFFAHKPLKPGEGRGTFSASAPVFRGFSSGSLSQPKESLFDYTTEAKVYKALSYEQECFTDRIVATGGTVIATDHCDQPAVATFAVGSHMVMAEGNVARFYGDKDYFNRAVLYLLP